MDIDYLLLLQGIREAAPNFVTSVFTFISELAISNLGVILFAVVYWCLDKNAGVRMLFTYSFTATVNQIIKNTACVYRPWIRDSRIHLAKEAVASATGYSFPSGHTATAVSFYGGFALWLKKYGKRVVIPLLMMILLTAFSRNWLGAHTPQDVGVALLFSGVLLFASAWLLQWMEQAPKRDLLVAAVGILWGILLVVYATCKPYPMDYTTEGVLLVNPWDMMTDCYKMGGIWIGFLTGWLTERRLIRFEICDTGKEKILRALCGVIFVLALHEGGKAVLKLFLDAHWSTLFSNAFSMLMITVGYPALFWSLSKRAAKKKQQTIL